MEMTFKNYKYKDNLLNFTIETAKINGITGKDTEELVRIINLWFIILWNNKKKIKTKKSR